MDSEAACRKLQRHKQEATHQRAQPHREGERETERAVGRTSTLFFLESGFWFHCQTLILPHLFLLFAFDARLQKGVMRKQFWHDDLVFLSCVCAVHVCGMIIHHNYDVKMF